LAFISLSSQYLNRLEIKTEAEPYLRRLSEELGETVFLAILDHNEVVYLDKVERFDGLRRYSIIGQRVPVHCTSLGKSLMLDKTDEEILKLLILPMQRFTPYTLVNPEDLLKQMRIFRKKGWTRDIEERDVNVSCIGAPIRDYRGDIIAAISSAWEGKKGEAQVEALAAQIKATADRISAQLGYLA
jgi:DNA-binding IclR family transcriptional regulator